MRKRQRKGRPVNGILLLDKGQGLTSNGALQEVKRLYNAAKVGHTGSLDPMATGILPLCFGEGTKFSQFLLDANKHYLATFKLGITTNTGDADGTVIAEREVGTQSEASIRERSRWKNTATKFRRRCPNMTHPRPSIRFLLAWSCSACW